MQSSTAEIKQLLKSNQFYRMQAANGMGGDLKEKLDFLDKAINALNEEDTKLIRGIYFEKIPVTRVAKNCFCARRTVYYRCEKLIEQLAEVYSQRFG